MRRFILQLHLYAGLFCSAYLLVYGVTSLAFNHAWGAGAKAGAAREWRAEVAPPQAAEPQAMAEEIRDRLGLMGWAPPGEVRGDGSTSLRFTVERPGKSYKIQWQRRQGLAQVRETRKGFWPVLKAMHGLRAPPPNANFLHAWGWYTEITTFLVVFVALSGLYLWRARRIELFVGGVVLLTITALSLVTMLIVTLHG
jgi:hypothetical protein